MARKWSIHIPVRPKAVQSVRGTRNSKGRMTFYPDHKVLKWKDQIRPYIEAACDGGPSDKPLVITRLRYTFRCPSSAPKKVRTFIEAGGLVPYIGTADITDNLSKGLIDMCANRVCTNDKNIWRMCSVEKVYGMEDCIDIEFEESPDVMMIDGRTADRLTSL